MKEDLYDKLIDHYKSGKIFKFSQTMTENPCVSRQFDSALINDKNFITFL
jgi:hypothetical protein